GYLAYGLLGDAILQKFGTRLRAIPAGNDMARMINLRAGKTQFAGQGLDIYFSMYGLDRYAKREWGPLDLRAVWLARHSGWSIAARADSDIHKVQDLKGKKCGWIPGSVMNNGMEALLSYGGLSWDDVVKVQKSGYVVQIKALLDGSVDVVHGAVGSPAFYEVASGPHGLRWLPLRPDDKEAIARVQKHLPMWTSAPATIGANIDEKHPLNCFTYAYPATLCMASLNDEIAYFMTKAIHETYSIHAPKSKMMKNYWSLDVCLELIEKSHYLIVHPGSIRYLKEIGAWKPGWDEEQAKRIKLHKKVMDLWEEMLEESYAKKIKDKEFPKYWNEKRIAKFGF
ncbi:MAG: TAXI family TRAP transporter solute-binding subunit, partial [Desulfobacteraceae bacterium]|nr:TAXI family TRAP transporter solute-binding subunit [Desulfobacteraceae bacterium]